jgi:hypothetical protein
MEVNMEYILLLIIIGLGVLLYLEHKKNNELIEGLKQSMKVSTYLSNNVDEKKIDEEVVKKEKKIRKAFNNLMDYGYETALNGHKEEE